MASRLCEGCGVTPSQKNYFIFYTQNNGVKCDGCLKVAKQSFATLAEVFKRRGGGLGAMAVMSSADRMSSDLSEQVKNRITIIIPGSIDALQQAHAALCSSFCVRTLQVASEQITHINDMLIKVYEGCEQDADTINIMAESIAAPMSLKSLTIEKNKFDIIILEPIINVIRESLAVVITLMDAALPQDLLEAMNMDLVEVGNSIDKAVCQITDYMKEHIEV